MKLHKFLFVELMYDYNNIPAYHGYERFLFTKSNNFQDKNRLLSRYFKATLKQGLR